MPILSLLQNAITALRLGHELSNAAGWKNRQTVINLLSAIVALIVAFGFKVSVTDDTLSVIAAVLMALANAYFTLATSRKVGIAPPLPPTAENSHGKPTADPPSIHRPPDMRVPRRVHYPMSASARDRPKPVESADRTTLPDGWNDR